MKQNEGGFTLPEVLLAIMVLGIGVVALAGSAGLITRMLGQGRFNTQVAMIAERRFEVIRQQALATAPTCTALADGTQSHGPSTHESWQVTAPVAGTRQILVTVTSPTQRGAVRTDSLFTIIRCP